MVGRYWENSISHRLGEANRTQLSMTHGKRLLMVSTIRPYCILLLTILVLAGVFSVTAEEVERLGKKANSTVMLPPESGGGYMASMEATHQLHCLVYYPLNACWEDFSDVVVLIGHVAKVFLPRVLC